MKKLLLILLILLFPVMLFASTWWVRPEAWAADVYVKYIGGTIYYDNTAASCDDVTVADASGTLQNAVDATGTDTCYLCSDITGENAYEINFADDDDGITIDLGGYTLTGGTTDTVIDGQQVDNLTIKNGTIVASGSRAVNLYGEGSSVTLSNLTLQDGTDKTVRIRGSFDNLIMEDCIVTGGANAGAYMAGNVGATMTNPIVRRCTFSGNGTTGANNHDGLLIGDNCTGILVEDSIFEDNLSEHGAGFDTSSDANGDITGMVQRCIMRNNEGNGVTISGSRAGDSFTIQSCLIYNNHKNLKIYGTNIDVTIYGNTIGSTVAGRATPIGVYFDHGNTDAVTIFKNNIISGDYTYAIAFDAPLSLISDYNCIVSGSSDYAVDIDDGIPAGDEDWSTWQARGYDVNSITGDPQFKNASINDFTLHPHSPCINAGERLGSSYDKALHPASIWPTGVITIDQDDYGSGWEIGAYGYPYSSPRRPPEKPNTRSNTRSSWR